MSSPRSHNGCELIATIKYKWKMVYIRGILSHAEYDEKIIQRLKKKVCESLDDLAAIFGSESIVSEVLHKKRDLSKTHIEKLSKRFHVSPAMFF